MSVASRGSPSNWPMEISSNGRSCQQLGRLLWISVQHVLIRLEKIKARACYARCSFFQKRVGISLSLKACAQADELHNCARSPFGVDGFRVAGLGIGCWGVQGIQGGAQDFFLVEFFGWCLLKGGGLGAFMGSSRTFSFFSSHLLRAFTFRVLRQVHQVFLFKAILLDWPSDSFELLQTSTSQGKIEELKKSGVPEKYWAELARPGTLLHSRCARTHWRKEGAFLFFYTSTGRRSPFEKHRRMHSPSGGFTCSYEQFKTCMSL